MTTKTVYLDTLQSPESIGLTPIKCIACIWH